MMKKWLAMMMVMAGCVVQADVNIYYVSIGGGTHVAGSHTSPYTNWVNAATNIQAVADLAESNSIILLDDDIFVLSTQIVVDNAVTVQGRTGNPDDVVIDGNWRGSSVSGGCFKLLGGSKLESLTVTNAYVNAGSGHAYGGGVYCVSTNEMIVNCVISGNRIYCYETGKRYNDSASVSGGGVYKGTLYNCVIEGNSSYAGKRYSAANAWAYGAGAYGSVLHNSLIVANDGEGISRGGGAYASMLYNCTVVNNSSHGTYGGINRNTIVWDNTPANYSGSAFQYSCTTAGAGVTDGVDGNVTNNPLFVDGVSSKFQLQEGSLCIDVGQTNYVSSANDLNGNPRIIDAGVDMGAYEFYQEGGDVDGDGLPNWWESIHFGNITNGVSGVSCSNGINTVRQAYIAGLDPNNPQSTFLTSIFRDSFSENILGWSATSGRVYSVQWATNLFDSFQPLETNIPWTVEVFTDSVHNAQGQGYYKINVRLQE